MAISSVGGGEPTETIGTGMATPGNAELPASGSATATQDTSGEGAPFYVAPDGTEYKTSEDLTKAWDERNATGGAETTPGNDTLAGDSTTAGPGNDTLAGAESDDAIKERLKAAGGIYADERYAPFALEFEKAGDLTPESVKKAAEAFGIPESFVQEFINNAKAAKASATAQAGQPSPEHVKLAGAILEVVPEESDYRAILAWGKDSLTPSEQAAYDSALNRADGDTAKALLTGFQQRFNASGSGKGPRDVTTEGEGGLSSTAAGYASSAEMQRDMADPKYQDDPAFRREVERKVAASRF